MSEFPPIERTQPTNVPTIALKLSPSAQKQQLSNPDFIASFIQNQEPELKLAISVNPLIISHSRNTVLDKTRLAAQLDPTYQAVDFDTWYQVRFEPQGEKSSISALRRGDEDAAKVPAGLIQIIARLQKQPEVESVHALQSAPPPGVNASDDPRAAQQGYQFASPDGIDARFAWNVPGGDGFGTQIVDLEQGWNLNHEDLVAANVSVISGENQYYPWHG